MSMLKTVPEGLKARECEQIKLREPPPVPYVPVKDEGRIDYDYEVGQKVLLRKEGILCNAESRWHKKHWLITTVHTNGTITVQRGTKVERMNIWRVKPIIEDLDNK